MKNNFDLKKFLTENKLTRLSLNENDNQITYPNDPTEALAQGIVDYYHAILEDTVVNNDARIVADELDTIAQTLITVEPKLKNIVGGLYKMNRHDFKRVFSKVYDMALDIEDAEHFKGDSDARISKILQSVHANDTKPNANTYSNKGIDGDEGFGDRVA
jgi:hypothetical protein